MATIELVNFLLESAEKLLNKAESALPVKAVKMLDEAEELLELASRILFRQKIDVDPNQEAA
tara:strand:+ start:408 stop:593 length:186 start_codon:yes stop_codon:yes gene_type:complete